MSPQQIYNCIEAVLGLPLRGQAECLRSAAEASAPAWREWCGTRGISDSSETLLDTFDRWQSGTAPDAELDRVAKQFLKTLPQNLPSEDDPTGGYAGWSLLGIALIALDQCEDVHRDILHTDICYAAAAYCRIRVGPTQVSWPRLSPVELEFLDRWWSRCCKHFPELTGSEVRADPMA